MGLFSDDVFQYIDDEIESRFRETSVDIGHGRSLSLYDLILGWAVHVRRLLNELGENLEGNPNIWNEHDYVAALGIRDFVEMGIGVLDSDLGKVARELVSRVDSEYVSFTQGGYRDPLERVAGLGLARNEWWWDRAPRQGFILDNINNYYQ
jgi:hypothetical protein